MPILVKGDDVTSGTKDKGQRPTLIMAGTGVNGLIFLSDTSFAWFSKLTIVLGRLLVPVLIFRAEIL